MTRAGPIRTLIIDDSPLFRRALAVELERASDVHVTTCDGRIEQVRAELLQHHPDAIVLDLKLRSTDSLVLLRKLATHYPVPLLACTDAAGEPRDRAARALELGAGEVVRKPVSGRAPLLAAFAGELQHRLRAAVLLAAVGPQRQMPRQGAESWRDAGLDPQRFVVVIGASTGGTEALSRFFRQAPADFPPVAVVQHMPVGFTRPFAERLNAMSAIRVREAAEGQTLRAGEGVVARGDTHLTLRAAGACWVARYTHSEPVNRHCPSVDVLFDSVVCAGSRAVGVLLTGMGADGAAGLLRLRQAGALTIGQNEASCVVYGMPKVATDLGAVTRAAPPEEMPGLILRAVLERAGGSEKVKR